MCLNPQCRKIIGTDGKPRMLHYNCGKCIECVKALQRDWALRISAECRNWHTKLFVTLKYSQERVPHADIMVTGDELEYIKSRYDKLPPSYSFKYLGNPNYDYCRADTAIPIGDDFFLLDSLTFDKAQLQRFIKRVRKILGEYGLKYFLCSEYGPKTLRPHYHAIMMSNAPVGFLMAAITQEWLKEACYNSSLADKCIDMSELRNDEAAAKYVSKYCCKPSEFEHPLVYLGKLDKPFRIMSKGLGIAVADELREKYNRVLLEYKIRPVKIKKDDNHKFVFDPDFLKSFIVSPNLYEALYQLFRYNVQTSKGIYSIPYPRYWRDRCFPAKIAYRVSVDDNGDSKIISYAVKNGDHPISLGYSNYVQALVNQDFDARYTEMRFLNPDLPDEDVIRILIHEDKLNLAERYRNAVQGLRKMYAKSLY